MARVNHEPSIEISQQTAARAPHAQAGSPGARRVPAPAARRTSASAVVPRYCNHRSGCRQGGAARRGRTSAATPSRSRLRVPRPPPPAPRMASSSNPPAVRSSVARSPNLSFRRSPIRAFHLVGLTDPGSQATMSRLQWHNFQTRKVVPRA